MNLGLLRTAVYDQTGLDANDGLVTPAVVTSRLNRAIHAYEAEGTFPWLQQSEIITTVAGTDTYTPGATAPAGVTWLRTSEIRDANQDSNVLNWQSPTELDDKWNLTMQGFPKDFTIYQDRIILRPIPDAAYTLLHRFEQTEIDLVADSDTPILPAMYHEVLIEYASYLCFRRSRETERMQEALNAYNSWVVKMRSRALRRADLPGRVRIRPGGWL